MVSSTDLEFGEASDVLGLVPIANPPIDPGSIHKPGGTEQEQGYGDRPPSPTSSDPPTKGKISAADIGSRKNDPGNPDK